MIKPSNTQLNEHLVLNYPDGAEAALQRLPNTRHEALAWVSEGMGSSVMPGRYRYVRRITDSNADEIDITEIAVDVYPRGRAGMTALANRAKCEVTAEDIEMYLQWVKDIAGIHPPVIPALLAYAGNPRADIEQDSVWLVLEAPSGETRVEFLLVPTGKLWLANTTESKITPVFRCELPSVRSLLRFAVITQAVLGADYPIHVRSIPLNENSLNWFS